MDIDAEHRPLVIKTSYLGTATGTQAHAFCYRSELDFKEAETMGRGILLWLLGVPIPVIILLWLFFGR